MRWRKKWPKLYYRTSSIYYTNNIFCSFHKLKKNVYIVNNVKCRVQNRPFRVECQATTVKILYSLYRIQSGPLDRMNFLGSVRSWLLHSFKIIWIYSVRSLVFIITGACDIHKGTVENQIQGNNLILILF